MYELCALLLLNLPYLMVASPEACMCTCIIRTVFVSVSGSSCTTLNREQEATECVHQETGQYLPAVYTRR